jgi:hypothetical protein
MNRVINSDNSEGDTMSNETKTDYMNDDPDVPNNIDFSKGVRGKFYAPNMTINLPVYLEQEVQAFLVELATKKGVEMSDVLNELIKQDMALLNAMR